MTADSRNESPESIAEVAAALNALKRARARAERVAAATGTALIFAVDGKPVRVQPRVTTESDPDAGARFSDGNR